MDSVEGWGAYIENHFYLIHSYIYIYLYAFAGYSGIAILRVLIFDFRFEKIFGVSFGTINGVKGF